MAGLINIDRISDDVNFWLVRTRGGLFYDEYINKKCIGLGWNILCKNEININKKEEIIEEVNDKYKTKQGSTIFNKCDKFINKMKDGDIVMIPDKNNREITFAVVHEYYEIEEFKYEDEMVVEKRIKDGIDYGTNLECPYRKRRRIEIIKSVEGRRLNPNLYKALVSSHGISDINKYSDFILSSIYNFYVWKEKLNLVLNIEQNKGIDAKYFSQLMHYTTELLTINSNDVKVYTKVNVNSPGDTLMTIVNEAGEWINYLQANWFYIFILWGAISGIKIGPLDLKSIPEVIIRINSHLREKKSIELDNEMKSLEIDSKRMDNELKKIELEKKKRVISESVNKIKESASILKVDKNTSSNVISINFDKKDDVY